MATVKHGILVKSQEWWKHLRWTKRTFWHRERNAERRDVADRLDEAQLRGTREQRVGRYRPAGCRNGRGYRA